MQITIDHIRYAQNNQLARLLRVSDPSMVSRWTHRSGFSLRSLQPAIDAGIHPEVLVAGLVARRDDANLAKQYQQELDEFLRVEEDVAS